MERILRWGQLQTNDAETINGVGFSILDIIREKLPGLLSHLDFYSIGNSAYI